MEKDNHEEESSSLKFSISFLSCEVHIRCFKNICWYNYVIIMMKIMIFLFVKCSSIENVDGLSVVFTISHKKYGFSKLIKKMRICYKIGVLNQCL